MLLPTLEEAHQTKAVPTLGGHWTAEITQADETCQLFSQALHQICCGHFLMIGHHQDKAILLVWDSRSPLQSQLGDDRVLCCYSKKLLFSSMPDYTK